MFEQSICSGGPAGGHWTSPVEIEATVVDTKKGPSTALPD